MKLTRFGFFAGLFGAPAAAQTVITACAPVYVQMPKPCEGQCPACGLAHGFVTLETLRSPGWDAFALRMDHPIEKMLFECSHCRNAFVRPVAKAVWDQFAQGETR